MGGYKAKSVWIATAMLAVAAVATGQLVGVHSEIGDAGSFRFSAQIATGGAGISGTLSGAQPGPGGGDFEDCYIINIIDPAIFQAQSDGEFDTQLWLFGLSRENEIDAFGLLANDEIPDGPPGPSLMPNQSNDGTNIEITEVGCYMLCISAFDNDPTDGVDEIFFQEFREEVSGPDGTGGNNPHADWSQNVGVGEYLIMLQGTDDARGVCEPLRVPATSHTGLGAMLALLSLLGSVLVWRRSSARSGA